MPDRIKAFLETKPDLTAASRQFLEVMREQLAKTSKPSRAAVRSALAKRSGKVISEAALAQRLKRLNDELRRRGQSWSIASSVGALLLDDGITELESDLEERSDTLTKRLAEGAQPPRAMPEKLTVFFSHAWQDNDAQQRAQIELFDRLEDLLQHPTAQYASLPRIELWRDKNRLDKTCENDQKLEQACKDAFLALIMASLRYPHRKWCLRELDAFIGEDGENLPGKSAIIIPVNCKRPDLGARFSNRLRLWFDNDGMTLVESLRQSERNKHDYAVRVANEIFEAARRYLGLSDKHGRDEVTNDAASTADTIAEYFEQRRYEHLAEKMMRGRAVLGSMTESATARKTSANKHEGGSGSDIIERLTDWAMERNGPRMVALLGDFGMGKTVTCQVFTQTLLKLRRKHPDKGPLPIYLDLRDIKNPKAAGKADLEALMADMLPQVGARRINPKDVIGYARERGSVVIFDGIDEVTNKLEPAEAQSLFRTILGIVPPDRWIEDDKRRRPLDPQSSEETPKRGRQSKSIPAERCEGPLLLLSCRTHYFATLGEQRSFLVGRDRAGIKADQDIKTWFMLPFNGDLIESYLKQNLGDAAAAQALAMIETTYNLKELAQRPILLKMFTDSFHQIEKEKLAGRQIDIGRLYDIFVDQIFSRDEPKHVIPVAEKKLLLAELALHLHLEGIGEIDNADLDRWLTQTIDKSPDFTKLGWELKGSEAASRFQIFLQDLRNATLLVRPGESSFRFGHTSVREFFLAEVLHRHIRDGLLERLTELPMPSQETIDFLLARQKNGVDSKRANTFTAQLQRLLTQGKPRPVRWLAASLIWRAGGELPWPDKPDLSDLVFSGLRFVASGQKAKGHYPFPPPAIWHRAKFQGACFEGINFSGHDLSQADASASRWHACDLSGATLEGLDLRAAHFHDCGRSKPLPSSVLIEHVTGVRNRDALSGLNARPGVASWTEIEPRALGRANALAPLTLEGRPVLASAGDDRTVRLWDPASGALLRTLEGHTYSVWALAPLTIAGRPVLASAGVDRTVRLWDPASGALLRTLEGHTNSVSALTPLTIEGRPVLASAGSDGTVRLWDPASGALLRTLEGHKDGARALTPLSIAGRPVLASAGDDGTVRLWDPASGALLRTLEEHKNLVTALTPLTIAGRPVLASAGDDGTVRLWDPQSGKELGSATAPRVVTALGVTDAVGPGLRLTAVTSAGIAIFDPSEIVSRAETRWTDVRHRLWHVGSDFGESFVDVEPDAVTGGVRATAIGRNAWRHYIAAARELDGRASVRPIDDMLNYPVETVRR